VLGHRLKNSVGTKTSLALGNCIATQRLVLTGTPIQNNLDELFAVVHFVAPHYLGTLEEFQRHSAKVIAAGNDPRASPKIVSLVCALFF
jgi:SNF2 family DNA or RNA helicase